MSLSRRLWRDSNACNGQNSQQMMDVNVHKQASHSTLPPLRRIPKTEVLVVIRLSGDRALSLRSPLPPPSQPHPNSQHTERKKSLHGINKVTEELSGQNSNAEDQSLSPCDSSQAKPSQADPTDSTVLIRSPMSYLGRTAMLKINCSHPVIQGLISQPS